VAVAFAAVLACASLASAEPAAPATTPPAPGPAVAIGGDLRFDNHAVWSRLVELAGGPGARFVVLGTASADPVPAAAETVEALVAHGAEAEVLPVAPRLTGVDLEQAVRDPRWIERVRAAGGVYFTGGAQERIVDTLQPGGRTKPLLEAIRDLQARGGVVAGTSAGAAIMSGVMFRDPPGVVDVMKGALRDGRDVDRGLGFVGPDLFVDQHFLRRGRLGRMLPLMLSRGYRLGIGVEENSAAIVHGGAIEVLGPGGAVFVDLGEARSDPALGAFNLSGAKLSYLGDGDRIDLATRAVTPSAGKAAGQRIDPHAPGFEPYFEDALFLLDVLGEGAVLRAMTQVLDGRLDEVRGLAFDARPAEPGPASALGFEFRFSRGPDTVGWYDPGVGAEAYTIANVRLDVVPVRVAQPLYAPWKP